MSMDEAGSESTFGGGGLLDELDGAPAKPAKKQKIKVVPASVATERKHRHDSVYTQDIVGHLNKITREGWTVLAITSGVNIRGFEVVSYKDEANG